MIRFLTGDGEWKTKKLKGYEDKVACLTDGPHGVRKENPHSRSKDGFNKHCSFKASCFPVESCLSTSWSKEVFAEVGEMLANEAKSLKVNCLLGPGINHKRTPIGGRNFEYISEDPFLTSELAISYVTVMQKAGTSCCLKHFYANNSERNRTFIDTIIDETTEREIYLRAFERVIRNAKPLAVMSAYNKVNGKFCSQNKELLMGILRKEWNYEGLVISDWGAVHNKTEAINAGCDLEMPFLDDKCIAETVNDYESGKLDKEALENSLSRVKKWIDKICEQSIDLNINFEDNYQKIKKITARCGVLLKNDVDGFTVCYDSENSGDFDAYDILQVYVRKVESSYCDVGKELKGFNSEFLKKNEKKTSKIKVMYDDLARWDKNKKKWVVESGLYKVYISENYESDLTEFTIDVRGYIL